MTGNSSFSLLLASTNESLAGELANTGINVCRSTCGFETIRLAMEQKPDALILDGTTYGLPSPTVAIWLKLNPSTQSLPVIGMHDDDPTWQEAPLDAEVSNSESIEKLVEITRDLIANSVAKKYRPVILGRNTDPLSITLDLIAIYRERLSLASAMIELASFQNDLGDFEYTIKSLLEATGRALRSSLVSISLVQEQTHFVHVCGKNATESSLTRLNEYNLTKLNEHLGKPAEITNQLVFQRRKILEDTGEPAEELNIFGHPIFARGKIFGYLSGIGIDNQKTTQCIRGGLLSDIASQIALLLFNADMIAAHETYVGELSKILRAVVEVSSISPLSGTSSKSFILQFLLIVLELCATNKGCMILFNKEKSEIEDVAALNVDENEILSSPLKPGKSLSESLLKMSPSEIVTDTVKLSSGKNSRLVIPLVAGETIMGGLVVLGFHSKLSPRIIEAVTTLATLAGYFIYNRELHLHSIKTSIMEDQLKIAREIQLEMLPDGSPEFPGFDIFGCSIPAKEVGGDFFDYYHQDGHLGIAIGDVCGKNVPASLLMTMTRALFLAATETYDLPNEVLKMVNSLLTRTIAQGKFVTGALLYLKDNILSYASAGHQPLIIYRASEDKFEEIDADGIALGIVGEMEFELVKTTMNTGDVALMFTDGLNEAMNPDRVQFGYGRIQSVIRQYASNGANEIMNTLFNAMRDHTKGADLFDDTTIIVIKKIKEGMC
ncbi:MAG: SpoIIE family protein phosphatase [bacterium]|nr:SpoIIE family protein phosphatase [bacterium]